MITSGGNRNPANADRSAFGRAVRGRRIRPASSGPARPPPPGPEANATDPHQEFLRFLRQVAKAYLRRKLHLVVDNYATHKHPAGQAWLARNPRITLHLTPTSGSWLNMVEIFFSIITRQAIRRGSFTSVKDLITAIQRFIDGWNERCHPFVWTKTAEDLLDHCRPGQRTSFTRH